MWRSWASNPPKAVATRAQQLVFGGRLSLLGSEEPRLPGPEGGRELVLVGKVAVDGALLAAGFGRDEGERRLLALLEQRADRGEDALTRRRGLRPSER